MSLTVNELQKAYPGGFAVVPVEVLHETSRGVLSGGNVHAEDISEADVLMAILRRGERGTTVGTLSSDCVPMELIRKKRAREEAREENRTKQNENRIQQILAKLVSEKKVISEEKTDSHGNTRTVYYIKAFKAL